jgi:hypothetical protein
MGLAGALGAAGSVAQAGAGMSAANTAQGAYQGYADFLGKELDRQQKFYDKEWKREDKARTNFVADIKQRTSTHTAVHAGRTATRWNIARLPEMATLTDGLNDMTTASFSKSREAIAPGIMNRLATQFGLVAGQSESLMKGEIPSDVAAEIQDRAAERSQRTGINTSGIGQNSVLRQLGLTSLQGLQIGSQLGQSNLDFASKFTPFVSPMDVAQFSLVTPMQQAQTWAQGDSLVAQLPWFTPKTMVSRIPQGQAQMQANSVPVGASAMAGVGNVLGSLGSAFASR